MHRSRTCLRRDALFVSCAGEDLRVDLIVAHMKLGMDDHLEPCGGHLYLRLGGAAHMIVAMVLV